MRKTKIICTIGPASENEETLAELMKAGMNMARFNFSTAHRRSRRLNWSVSEKLRRN